MSWGASLAGLKRRNLAHLGHLATYTTTSYEPHHDCRLLKCPVSGFPKLDECPLARITRLGGPYVPWCASLAGLRRLRLAHFSHLATYTTTPFEPPHDCRLLNCPVSGFPLLDEWPLPRITRLGGPYVSWGASLGWPEEEPLGALESPGHLHDDPLLAPPMTAAC